MSTTALITGGTSGIGRAVANKLARLAAKKTIAAMHEFGIGPAKDVCEPQIDVCLWGVKQTRCEYRGMSLIDLG